MSLNDSIAYTDWFGQKIDAHCRLPTEAEWEYAARAGSKGAYWWGEIATPVDANYCENNCDKSQSSPVASFEANKFGLYDTSGNVWEMTCSEWSFEFDGRERYCPDEKLSEKKFVVRGGAHKQPAVHSRSSARGWGEFEYSSLFVGFRIVCE